MYDAEYLVNLNSYKLSLCFILIISLYYIINSCLSSLKNIIPLNCTFIFDNLIQQISISGFIIIVFYFINNIFNNYLENKYGNSLDVVQTFIVINIISFILQGFCLFLFIISENSRINKKSSINFSKTLLLIYNSQENQFSFKEIKSLIEFKIISDYFISIKMLPREFDFDHYYSITYKKYLKEICNNHIFSGIYFAIICVTYYKVNFYLKTNNLYELYCKDNNFNEDNKLCNESILLLYSIVLLIMSIFFTCLLFIGNKFIKILIEDAFHYRDVRYKNSSIFSSIEEEFSYERYLEYLVKERNEKLSEIQLEERIEKLLYIKKVEEDILEREKDSKFWKCMTSFFSIDLFSFYVRFVEVSIYSITFYFTIFLQQIIWLSFQSEQKYWFICIIPIIMIYNLYILRKMLQKVCLLVTFHKFDKDVASFVLSNGVEKKMAEKYMIESITKSLKNNSLTQDYILNLVDCIDTWKSGLLNKRQLLIFFEAIDVFLTEVQLTTIYDNLDFQKNGSGFILFADLIDLFLPCYDLEESLTF